MSSDIKKTAAEIFKQDKNVDKLVCFSDGNCFTEDKVSDISIHMKISGLTPETINRADLKDKASQTGDEVPKGKSLKTPKEEPAKTDDKGTPSESESVTPVVETDPNINPKN